MRRMSASRLVHRLLAGRRVREPRALILVYHRVTQIDSDPQLLCVGPRRFAEHMEVLRKDYHPLSLRDLQQRVRDGGIPRKGVVVTFDDGYADNLYEAKPLLERHD